MDSVEGAVRAWRVLGVGGLYGLLADGLSFEHRVSTQVACYNTGRRREVEFGIVLLFFGRNGRGP